VPRVLIVEGRIGDVKPVRTAIIMSPGTWLWVDAGIATTPRDAILPELRRRGLPPPERNLLLVTHCDVDHFGGAAALRAEVPGMTVLAHPADARLMEDLDVLIAERYDRFGSRGIPAPPARLTQLRERAGAAVRADVHVRAGTGFDLGEAGMWEVLELPGHSAGHLGLAARDGEVVFAGDAVMGRGVLDGTGSLQPPHYVDVDAYLGTIDRMASLQIGTLHLGHEPALSGDALDSYLELSRQTVHEIGDAVSRATGGVGTADLAGICEAVHASLGHWPDAPAAALADPITAHLRASSGRMPA
jgi:glyoxylase-like metal-dependent hydrolase (beta-lactamase superfamily II)